MSRQGGHKYGKNGQRTPINSSDRPKHTPTTGILSPYEFLCHWARDTPTPHRSGPTSSAQHVPSPSTGGTDRASNMTETAKICPAKPPFSSIYSNRRQPSARATVIRPMPSWSVMVRLPTASRRLRGRDANLCRSRRHVMCRIRRRSVPDSPEYPKYALLSDCYRYIRRRGSGMPPSEALNRADEWSFSLCCVAIFLLAVCGTAETPSETSRPCFSVRLITRASPPLAIV